jgi:peptide/nickel transport system substrate-binding protein
MRDNDNYWTRARTSRLSRRRFVAGAGVFAAGSAAILAGCGDDDDETPTPTATGTATRTATATGTGTAATPTQTAARRGGVLRLAKPQVDEGLDPGLKVVNNLEILPSMYNHTHLYQVSENKFHLDAATSMEQPDATTIRFKIRSGMKFHNGDDVTAEDIAFTWSRFPSLLKEQGSQVNAANWGFISKVEAPDATTVVVTLVAPTASAPNLMASTAYGIVNRKLVEASPNKNVQDVDAGAGPYKLDRRDATGTRMVRFDGYYKHEQPSLLFGPESPYIDAWETSIIVDAAAAKSAFLAGNLDIYPQLGVSLTDKLEFQSLRGQRNITAREVDPIGQGMFVAFDNVRFQDIRARQAIRAAINYDALIATIHAGDGLYDAPVGIGQPAWALDQQTLKSYYKFDPAAAKRLWQEAGSPFQTLRIQLNQAPISRQFADFLKQQFEQNLNVRVELLVNDTTTWVARAREPQKQWELFLVPSTSGNVPEQGNMNLMAPNAFAGVSWSFGVDQPDAPAIQAAARAMQELVDAQARELNPEARKQKINALQKWVLDNVQPGLNLPALGHSYLAYNSRLKNVPENDWLKGLALRSHHMWIDA